MDRETAGRYRTRLLRLQTLLRDDVTRLAFTPDCPMTLQLWTRKEQRLQKIADALERIENGTYGRCRHCGRSILQARLTAVPFTDSCTVCATRNLNRSACHGEPGSAGLGEQDEWQTSAGLERPSARLSVRSRTPQDSLAVTRAQAAGAGVAGTKLAQGRLAASQGGQVSRAALAEQRSRRGRMIRRSECPTQPAKSYCRDVAVAAEQRLRQSWYQPLWTITCHYHEGMVFLRGRVNSYYLKQLAQETIRNVAGVEQIVNEIEVVFAAPP